MLNVFYIRPSDNGHYGIAEALLDQARPDVRVRTSLYRSTQFPLTYPLPRRLDAQMQGWHGLQAYHLLVLAGIDPEVLSPKETRDIIAFVDHGGGLLIVGGTTSGSARIGTWDPLAPVLPVEFLARPDAAVNAPAKAPAAHPVTRGLPRIESPVQTVHAVRAKRGATTKVLMTAGRYPLLVASEPFGATAGRGRVLFLNSYPQGAGVDPRCFFNDRFYPELIRQGIAWLTHAEPPQGITTFRPPRAAVPGAKLRLPVQVTAKGKCRLTGTLRAAGQAVATASIDVRRSGPAGVSLTIPRTPDLPGMLHAGLELKDSQGNLLGYRGFAIPARQPVEIHIELEGGNRALAPGMTLRAAVDVTDRRSRKAPLQLGARLLDAAGSALHEWKATSAKARQGLEWKLPDLAAGTYTLEVTAADDRQPLRAPPPGRAVPRKVNAGDDGQPLRTARHDFAVVDPMDNEHYFPLVSEAMPGGSGGGVCTSSADLRAMVDDVAAHGFNAIVFGDPGYPTPLTAALHVRRTGERHAQEQGLRIASLGHLVPDYSRTRPPDPCVNAPAFEAALRDKLDPILAKADLIPRHFMTEILDEPLIAGPMICRCPRCRAAFQKRYGYALPEWDVTCRPGMEAQRTDLLAFVADYWAEIFRRCYERKQARGVRFDVHHTYCQLTWGTFVSRYYWRAGFAWMPYCDRFDWDTYPYIYPIWRGHQELHHPNLRHHFAGHRSLARHFGKPMGHWLDLSDRNVPHANPPVRASSELVYTAIGQDSKLIRTFFNITFGRNNGPRKERWDDLGAELTKIGRYASVLTLAHKAREPLAMMFAATDWALRHHTSPEDLPPGTKLTDFPQKWDDAPFDDQYPFTGTPWNAYELLLRSFGEAALLPEELVAAGDLKHHRALAVWGAHFVARKAAQAIVGFVQGGGLLLCDTVPEQDERGAPLQGFAGVFSERFEPVCDGLAMSVRRVGKGHTVLFNQNINTWYTRAVVGGDVRRCADLQAAIRGFLARHAVLPHARAGDAEFEVDVLSGKDCFFIVVVNHAQEDRQTVLEIVRPPAPVGWVVDMGTSLEVAFASRETTTTLRLALGTRRGVILGVYPRQPAANTLKVLTPTVKRGEALTYEAMVVDAEGKPAPGHHPVEMVVRDPSGTERRRYGGQKATTGGRYNRSVPIAINERPGRWGIELRDHLTRRVSHAIFEVQ